VASQQPLKCVEKALCSLPSKGVKQAVCTLHNKRPGSEGHLDDTWLGIVVDADGVRVVIEHVERVLCPHKGRAASIPGDHQRLRGQINRDHLEFGRYLSAAMGPQVIMRCARCSTVAYALTQERYGLARNDIADDACRPAAPLPIHKHGRETALWALDYLQGVPTDAGRVLGYLGGSKLHLQGRRSGICAVRWDHHGVS